MVKNQSYLIRTKFLIRINPNDFDLGFIRINSDWKFGLDQSRLKLIRIKNLVRIDVSGRIGLTFDHFLSNEIQNVFRISSEWLSMVQQQIHPHLITLELPAFYTYLFHLFYFIFIIQ